VLYWDETTDGVAVGMESGSTVDAEAVGVALAQRLMKEARR